MLHLVVSVEKLYEGYGKMVGMAVLGCPSGRHFKQVTVVDDDVDPFDALAVEWAVATRVQPHRDVEIIKDVAASTRPVPTRSRSQRCACLTPRS